MRASLATLLVLVFCGCRGEPDDVFFYFGKLVDNERVAQANVPVAVQRGGSELCGSFGQGGDFSSSAPTPFEDFGSTQSDEQGEFLVQAMRYQIEPQGRPACFKLLVANGGANTELRFDAAPRDLELPPSVTWVAGAGQLTDVSGSPTLLPPNPALLPIPANPTDQQSELAGALTSRLSSGGEPAWVGSAYQPLVLSAELREDFAPAEAFNQLDLFQYLSPLSGFGGPGLPVWSVIRTAPTPLSTGTRVPVSRGASCTLAGLPLTPCTLTDGSLQLARFQPSMDAAPPALLELQLPAPAVVSTLVWRDAAFSVADGSPIQVEVSADGVSWASSGSVSLTVDSTGSDASRFGVGDYRVVPLTPPAAPVSHVRLRSDNPFVQLIQAREISVFD